MQADVKQKNWSKLILARCTEGETPSQVWRYSTKTQEITHNQYCLTNFNNTLHLMHCKGTDNQVSNGTFFKTNGWCKQNIILEVSFSHLRLHVEIAAPKCTVIHSMKYFYVTTNLHNKWRLSLFPTGI